MSAISKDLNATLRCEGSWSEVSSGLTKVLLGYLVFAFGLMLAGACISGSVLPLMNKKMLKVEHIWMFYIGGAVLKIATLTAWGMVISGQFRCLMSSTERHGARWVIFFCLTCVVMSPVLHWAAWIGGLASPIRWNLGPEGFQRVRFSMLGLYLLAASAISSGLYLLSFWYYLGTVARCLEAPRAGLMVGMFTLIVGPAIGGTAYLMFSNVDRQRFELVAAVTAAFWLAVPVYWFLMVVVVKRTIDQTLGLVKDPLRRHASRRSHELAPT